MYKPLLEVFILKNILYISGIALVGYVGYSVHNVSGYIKWQEQQRTWAVQTCQGTLQTSQEATQSSLTRLNAALDKMASSTVSTRVEFYTKLAPPAVYAPLIEP